MSANYRVVGPHAQTLFLGCSISEISMNLAWGGESSSCDVKLVNDYVKHYRAPEYAPLHSQMDSIVSTNTTSSTSTSTAILATPTGQQALKPIIKYEKDKKDFNINTEGTSAYPITIRDLGKKCWNPHDFNEDPYHWVDGDPGFLGDYYSIIGTACSVRFEDLIFTGLLNKWTYDNGLYSVNLSGPGSLLKGAKLIINEYRGTVSSLMPFTGDNGQNIAVPYNNPTVPTFFGNSISHGNIPNLFNIYGWLQNQGFGFAKVSDYGISALQVYNVLKILLGGGEYADKLDANGNPILNDPDGRTQNVFSPYGAIVAKSPIGINRDNQDILLNTLGSTFSGTNSSTSFTKLGLLRTLMAVDSQFRCLLRLDMSQVPAPAPGIYLPLQASMSIEEFISFCCQGAGYDWNCSIVPDLDTSAYSATIKINTFSRRIQYPPNVIKNFLRNLSAGDNVVSYDLGQEFKDQNVRKVVMGGKQERLIQAMTHTLSRFRSSRIYNPSDGTFMPVSDSMITSNLRSGSQHNIYREPLSDAQRMWDVPAYRMLNGAITAQRNTAAFNNYPINATVTNIPVGSYDTSAPGLTGASDPFENIGVAGQAAYPIHYDLISPYLGRGSDGLARKVFYDRKARQLLVNVPISDISSFFPAYDAPGNYITIYENEIRAALASFDSWITYIFEPTKYNMWKPSAKLIYAAISRLVGPTVANSLRLYGHGVTSGGGKEKSPYGTYHTGNSVSPSQAVLFSNSIMPILQAFHTFIRTQLGNHYGNDFMVRMPGLSRTVGDDNVARYDYEISDSGWEEPGNAIDDTILIGSVTASLLAQENGKFGPLLGWNNSAEFDYSRAALSNPVVANGAIRSGLSSAMQNLYRARFNFNNWYYPLVSDGEFISVPYGSSSAANDLYTIQAATLSDSYGKSIPSDRLIKIYQKASVVDVVPENSVNRKILFSHGTQYCVLKANAPVWIRDNDNIAKTIFTDCALSGKDGYEIADYAGSPDIGSQFSAFLNRVAGLDSFLLYLLNVLEGVAGNSPNVTVNVNNEQNVPIHPRAAMPCYAAVPVRYNLSLYGPWSTSPGEIASTIFPQVDNSLTWTDNVVGGVELDINPQYVPWEYGGMENLDSAVLTMLGDSNEYQQIEEAGRLTLAGVMLQNTNIGSRVFDNGPMCNSIQVTFGSDGIRTTYHFRTFSRKLGYFNKENAENIQRFGKQAMQLRTQLVENINLMRQRSRDMGNPSASSYVGAKASSFSPVSVLVGAASPFLHRQSDVVDFKNQCSFNPNWPYQPRLPNSVASNPKSPRHVSAVSLYDPSELDKTVFGDAENYNKKAVMSLDGIFSPISLYPTPYGATYPVAKYARSKCPLCLGTNVYNYAQKNENTLQASDDPDEMLADISQLSMPCPFCEPEDTIEKIKKKGAQPAEITPPYLIGSGTDRTLITDRNEAVRFQASIINNYTLNPVVLSATGADFSCLQAKQNNDRCGHSIDILAFGNVLPNANDALRAALSENPDKNYADIDVNADLPAFSQNYRFFGLRGPLMVHGWGYDLEGYPVPNSSGEIKTDAFGQPITDINGNTVGKNQQRQSDGTYSPPYKERTFARGWAQQPASWPVGPIDLRWDDNARVWTVGSNYKPVWVVLETDLVTDNPVRGIIVESNYSNEPLPSGLRKLVFVKDTMGMFSAPRGAALYCRYDSVNGFYEPIYNRPLVTSGLIIAANTATIYTAYTPSQVSEDVVSSYETVFDNPLNYGITYNTIGLFTFLNGKWVLQSSV